MVIPRFKKPSARNIKLRSILPSILTLICIWLGLTAIREAAIEQNYARSLILILFAMIFDAFDGRVARKLNVSSAFGAVFDSLADFLAFGVAPAFIIYSWSGHDQLFGWQASVLYASCMAMRLANFTAEEGKVTEPGVVKKYFYGIPAPAGGILLLAPIALEILLTEQAVYLTDVEISSYIKSVAVPFLIVIGLLLIIKIPTISLKQYVILGKYRVYILLGIIVYGLLLYEYLWAMWVINAALYLASIIYTTISNRSKQITDDSTSATPPQQDKS